MQATQSMCGQGLWDGVARQVSRRRGSHEVRLSLQVARRELLGSERRSFSLTQCSHEGNGKGLREGSLRPILIEA